MCIQTFCLIDRAINLFVYERNFNWRDASELKRHGGPSQGVNGVALHAITLTWFIQLRDVHKGNY